MIMTAHRTCFVVLCIVCLSGCIRPNMRYTETGSMSACATLQNGVLPLYHEVKIIRPADDSAPRLCLRLPDGRIIGRASLTCDGLRQVGFEESHRDYRSQYYDKKLGKTFDVSHELGGHGVTFVFVGDELVELRLFTSERSAIGIGREDTKTFYTFPLTQADLERLFGHPDRISDGVYW